MEEITEIRDTSIIAAEIETIKRQTQHMMLAASVEIGRRLVEAKELVDHGNWAQWLKEKVNYSQSTADNLMKIFREYGDEQISLSGSSKSQTFGNLSYSQAVALFALPADERANFVQENDVTDMTARQLQEAIKAKEQAEKEKADALSEKEQIQNKLDGTNKRLELAERKSDDLMQTIKKSDDDSAAAQKKAAEEVKKLQDQLAAVGAKQAPAPSPEELKKLRADVRSKVEADFKKKEDQLTLEKKTAEEKTVEIENKYKEKLKQLKLDNESILARQQAAEKRLAVAAPEAHQIDAYLRIIQQSFQNITVALRSLDSGNAEMAAKLRVGICKVLDSMKEQVSR
jgi:DNA repair exonuclease SbcCD ATPase subunit